ncbi:hypothetical protein LguiA_019836 [Lonicera macranthoides]
MGNRFICMTKKDSKESNNNNNNTNNGSRSKRMGRSQRKLLADEELLHRQALSMAIHQHQLSQRFDGSMSRRIGSTSSRRRNNFSDSFTNGKQVIGHYEAFFKKLVLSILGECLYLLDLSFSIMGLFVNSGMELCDFVSSSLTICSNISIFTSLPWRKFANSLVLPVVTFVPSLHPAIKINSRESPARPRSHDRNCSFVTVDQFCYKSKLDLAIKFCKLPEYLENLKTKKIVLIHGEGFGAWCWYKTIALLEESKLLPVALDLTGSGIDLTDTNSVTTLLDYSKPLIKYLQNLPEDEKVVLVGHSAGGACISYALEHFPQKISKAVFLCSTMISDGQRPFDVFAEELGSAELFVQESKFLIYGNGKEKPPTGFMFEKQQMHGLYFNQSPSKDVALAMVSMRPIPLGPIMEKMSLTPENYGSARRFFIQTLEDHALSPDIQEKLVRENPPEGVFKIKGSDHCPFFSKPQSLHKILLEIAQIP